MRKGEKRVLKWLFFSPSLFVWDGLVIQNGDCNNTVFTLFLF